MLTPKIARVLILTALLVVSGSCFGANHYVRQGASGTASGNDWTNAYTDLPASLVRGDTYFLADGVYGSHTFNDADSGTAAITIQKAVPSNHGTSTGWSDTYGAGQAAFPHWNFYTDYYTINGDHRNSDWYLGTLSQYGVHVSGTGPVRLDNGSGQGGNHLTFTYVDFQGGGRDTGSGDDVIYGLTGNSSVTFQYCALHDSDRTIFLMRGNWQNMLVDHSYIARNTSTPATHGEMLSMTDSTNVNWSYNVMEDIEGTAFIAGLNNGTAANWNIYGNVFFHSAAYIANTGRPSGHNFGVAGIIYVANDASQSNYGNNFRVYNNTMYAIQGSYSGVIIQAGTGSVVENNIWYNSVRTNNSFTGTQDYNWYFNTPEDGGTEAHGQTCTANCNIFVGDNISNFNFHLTANTNAGLALSSPFNVDPDGNLRSSGVWDRGGYELVSGSAPAPPTALSAQVQ